MWSPMPIEKQSPSHRTPTTLCPLVLRWLHQCRSSRLPPVDSHPVDCSLRLRRDETFGEHRGMMKPASTGTPPPNLDRREDTMASHRAPNADAVPTLTRPRMDAVEPAALDVNRYGSQRTDRLSLRSWKLGPIRGGHRRSCCPHLWLLAPDCTPRGCRLRRGPTLRQNIRVKSFNGCAVLFEKNTLHRGHSIQALADSCEYR